MSSRRITTLVMGLLVAAIPLLWMDLDPRAGDKLLRWTQGTSISSGTSMLTR
ncbi:MAG TPA: hypothetical protein VFV17_10885 [Usitatibacteraceae bacterium]|nr:hypothetical protein [Usitatibacteraceae bacterium]